MTSTLGFGTKGWPRAGSIELLSGRLGTPVRRLSGAHNGPALFCCPAGFWGKVLVTVGPPASRHPAAGPCGAGTSVFPEHSLVRQPTSPPQQVHSGCRSHRCRGRGPRRKQRPPQGQWGCHRGTPAPGCRLSVALEEGQCQLVRRSGRVIGNRWGVTRALAALTRVCPCEQRLGCQGLSRELAELPVGRIEGKMEETRGQKRRSKSKKGSRL